MFRGFGAWGADSDECFEDLGHGIGGSKGIVRDGEGRGAMVSDGEGCGGMRMLGGRRGPSILQISARFLQDF